MTNSATSTKPRPDGGSGFHAWQFFILAALVGATVVVMVSPNGSHPITLILLSAAVIFAGLVGLAVSRAVAGFFNTGAEEPPLAESVREALEREKRQVLRSIKELEFDKGMGKVSDADYVAIMGRLRARALTLMRDLERTPSKAEAVASARAVAPAVAPSLACPSCGTTNDPDARFCKKCGTKVGQ